MIELQDKATRDHKHASDQQEPHQCSDHSIHKLKLHFENQYPQNSEDTEMAWEGGEAILGA